MYSILIKCSLPRCQFYKTLLQGNVINRQSFSSAPEHQSIRKFKLMKRLASTLLFGSTFLAIVYARRHKHSKIFEEAKLVSIDSNYHKNFKLYQYKGYILPSFVMKNMDSVKNFVCREDDLFVVSFPKTGTTWLQEIIYCIMRGSDNSSRSIEDRFPYLEFMYPGISSIEKITDQRFIKTHLPYSLLPEDIHKKNPKILCIMRNPKDVLVSYYHFVRMATMSDYKGSFQNFFHDFIFDSVPYGPIWKHYNEIWEHRNDENILILSYEDFHKDIKGNIMKIAKFLGKSLTNNEIENIAEHCSFHSMSKNPTVNYQHWDDLGIRNKNESKFMRKGQVGDWKNYLSSDMNEDMNSWIADHFKDSSLLC